MKILKIMIICILLSSCSRNIFLIKLERQDYDLIYDLIVEINDRANKNDIEYFRQAFGNLPSPLASVSEEERKEYYDFLREVYQKEDYSDEEFYEYYINDSIESLIEEIIKANIVKTYKGRACFSNTGINFDYHWDRKDIHFQMYITKYWEDYITENVHNYGGIHKWKLYSIWECR